MSRTEAKRRYITTLIETMKVYASGTAESRELVGELEFVWGQIRSQSGSEGEADEESSTRKLERAGLKQTESYASIPPGRGGGPGGGGDGGSRLRVLSPVSRGGIDDIVEGEDMESPEETRDADGDDDDDEEDFRDARDGSEDNALDRRRRDDDEYSVRNRKWRRRMEAALTHMTAEIAALREQMSDSRVFGTARRRSGLLSWIRWLIWAALRQTGVNIVLVGIVVLWGRWKGDRRAEEWVKSRWKEISSFLHTLTVWKELWPGWIPRLA